jgi:hypothetical protein
MLSQKAGKAPFLSFRLNETCPGENREPESRKNKRLWTPVGVTDIQVVGVYESVKFHLSKKPLRCNRKMEL